MELRNTISSTSIRKMVLQKDTVHIAKNMFLSAHPNITRKDSAMCVDNRLLFVLWESLEDFVQSGTESILSKGDARLLVLCSGSFMPERGIKGAAIQIAKLPAMKSREESSLQMERKFPISFMICSNNGKCVGFRVEVYPYTLSDLSRHELKETGLREYALGQKKIDPGKYLYLWKTYPVLEQIVKAGLFQLVDDVLDHRAADAIKRKGRKPTEFLSVDKKEFRRLRDMNGGVKELKWLQLEKSTGKTIGDEEICWMVKEGFEPNDLKFVLDQMSICQIRHYLVKQSEKSGDDISHVLQVWNDYLSMAKRLGMDIHDSIIYRTKDLQLRHKEAVLKIEEMKRGIRRRELEEKYVGFQKHLIDLKEKYEFSDGEYQVIAPKSIDDILYEGDTLHHCVNKTDTYFDRIVSKESYILFLREKENPKVPFYTLEVEPDGTIRQKRAEFNRQNKDIDKVTSFLTLWQKEIQKRLTKKDRKSTEESRKLRQQNYQEIRDKHVVVHGGAFAGELLADLLEKDLMDLPVESAENGESPTEIAA